jgi:tetratricopeptide (TPR) repeat protein
MARQYVEEFPILEGVESDLSFTLLPRFPDPASIRAAFPEMPALRAGLSKADCLAWIEFTLENPDEIWERRGTSEKRLHHYLNFVEEEQEAPVFVVEVTSSDESVDVNNFSVILEEEQLELIRDGSLVYSRAHEWKRETLIRSLNEKALSKYDEDALEEAREIIDSAIRLSGSGSAYLFNNRGLICWKMGRTDEAKSDFRASIGLDAENGDACFNMGLIYFDEGDYPRALRYLTRAVEISPTDGQFLTELGHLYLELDRESEALKLFQRAFETNPGDPQVDFHLGYYFLYKKRKPRHAIKYYTKGLKKDPGDQFAMADLAVAHWILGNRRRAIEIDRALQLNKSLMPYTISRLLYLNLEMGHYDNALKYYRRALAQEEPFEPEWLHYNAALVYAKMGRSRKALDILDLAVRVGGEAVIRRAMEDETLSALREISDFSKVVNASGKRRNR